MFFVILHADRLKDDSETAKYANNIMSDKQAECSFFDDDDIADGFSRQTWIDKYTIYLSPKSGSSFFPLPAEKSRKNWE